MVKGWTLLCTDRQNEMISK